MSTPSWQITNLDQSSISLNQEACIDTGGRFSVAPDPNNPGKFIVSCVYTAPATEPDTDNTPIPELSGGLNVQIKVTDQDLEALKKVSTSEVGHFGKHGSDQLRGGLAAVVDTVFNRVAHKGYPGTIQGVINQDKQFSAINPLAGWHQLPDASAAVSQIVEEHVVARALGQPSDIKGATHFLNPYLSSATALANWGNFVKENPTAVYGSDAKKDVHYHGFPPDGTLSHPYSIEFRGDKFNFDPTGTVEQKPAAPASALMNELAQKIVQICHEEQAHFENGKKKENDDPQHLRVKAYWKAVGQSYDGTTRIRDEDGEWFRPAWSAAFVSYVLRKAGASNFPAKQAHAKYFQHFVQLTNSNLYGAVAQRDEVPEVGDIVHYGRGYAKRFDFAIARARFGADGSYLSHSDIVVATDLANREITAIGGNVRDSVKARIYKLDAQGKLLDRTDGGKTYPWIGILKLVR